MDLRTTAFLAGLAAFTASPHAGEDNLRRLLDAIREVESGSQPQAGRYAAGDQGRSIGPYQIQRGYWRDSRLGGRYEDVCDPRDAERVMVAYWQRYCPDALVRGDWRTLARVHNGGPQGDHNPATVRYWHKVKRALENR